MDLQPAIPGTENDSWIVPQTRGQVIHTPRVYELIVWVATRGREAAFRKFVAESAGLHSGESVLDVGCGTGTMAVLAKKYVGETGRVCGVEPSREMVAYARQKAQRQKSVLDIRPGVVEQLNFASQMFDVVLCLIVLHHMPDETKVKGIQEMARVLKPGGRLLVVDSNLQLLPPFEQAGFTKLITGPVPLLADYDYALWELSGK